MADLINTSPVSSGPFCSTKWTVILTDDFAIVFSTFSGTTQYIESTVNPEIPENHFTLTANEDNCGDAEKTLLEFCWFKIQFVDRASYDADQDPTSWDPESYKSVPSVQLKFTHGGTGTDLTIQAFRDLGQKALETYDEGTFVVGDPIEPCTDVAPFYSFSDFNDGIKEIVIKTDHDDSVLLDLFLYSDYDIFTHPTGNCFENPPPCIQCIDVGYVGQADGSTDPPEELNFNIVFDNKCWTNNIDCAISIETTTVDSDVFRLPTAQDEISSLTEHTVSARGTCTVNCVFRPVLDTTRGIEKTYQGKLVIRYASGEDVECIFEAKHSHSYAEISAAPPRADFPPTDVGISSDTIAIVLSNNGNSELVITDFVGPNLPEFTMNAPPTVIADGDIYTLQIVFKPLIDIQYDDKLTIRSNAENVDPLTGLEIPLTGTGIAPPTSRLVLLFDTSGSMSWDYLGNWDVPPEVSRLNLVRKAILPFLGQMKALHSGDAYLGIGSFPEHPWVGTCNGHTVRPCSQGTATVIQGIIDDLNANMDTTVLIDDIEGNGSTPLLAGIENAIDICGPGLQRAIVLLTDGYHNCPTTIGAFGPEVRDIITKLGAIKVYTIGFGKPGDWDSDLLTELAHGTGGEYYPVTVAGFEPGDWDPLTGLQAAYTKILAEGLGLGFIIEPFGVIKKGAIFRREVNICEYDKKVSLFLGWVSSQTDKLILRVFSSDGIQVPTSGTGVQLSKGAGHTILTVDKEFLQIKDKVGTTPWRIEIDASDLNEGESEKYQYSILVDSDLKLESKIIALELITGEELMIQAHVYAKDSPVAGLKDVMVSVETPEKSLGNWYAGIKVSEKELKGIDQKHGDELLSALHRKTIYMTKILKIKYPGIIKAGSLQLHGDKKANDGIYTNSFSNTKIEGLYTFDIKVSGTTPKGIKFTREAKVRRHLRAIFSPEHSDIKLTPVTITKGLQKIRVDLTPRDKYGNHLGPGYDSAIHLTPSIGQLVGTMNDDLSGSYSQIIEVPVSDISDARLKVNIRNTSKDVGIKPSTAGLRSLYHRFRWLLLVIIATLIIYIAYLGIQP